LTREEAIRRVVEGLGEEDVVVSTTGMTSRELFEYRECHGESRGRDFLTVGGMGHTSQIALGIAMQRKERRVFCIDGDGSVLMHMGSLAINGARKCRNFHHVVLNNGAHDSVGGMPTVAFDIHWQEVAKAVGYRRVLRADSDAEVRSGMTVLNGSDGPSLMEIRVRKGHRSDLGRPTTSPVENKKAFMEGLQ
jgi:phosphonopyruvate decarboxylase